MQYLMHAIRTGVSCSSAQGNYQSATSLVKSLAL
jgi:hypothetical protein